MTYYVKRTCREIITSTSSDIKKPSKKIEEWQESAAYILLAPPGSGKTTIFKKEATRQGGYYVTARDFITLDQEIVNFPIFIDGLDEQRAGANDVRPPLDQIRAKLLQLNKPKFRLSCREADWFGDNDKEHIKKVSPDKNLTILQLDPLKREDIFQILKHYECGVQDPDEFINQAQNNGLMELLENPLILKMLVKAVEQNNNWPKNRKVVFERACRLLLHEHNSEHSSAIENTPIDINIDKQIDVSGQICAILLLTGCEGFANKKIPNYIDIKEIPGLDPVVIRSCLKSKLFRSSPNGEFTPIHRQLAEFLAGRYLANIVKQGLPSGRILALITGYDGRVVSSLRGLSAWFASHSKTNRTEISKRDSLGTVLYGDVTEFSILEKKRLLESLREEADIFPTLLQTIKLDTRIGDLISNDIKREICEIIDSPSYSESGQTYLQIMLHALKQGSILSGIIDQLEKIIRDEKCWLRNRLLAIRVLDKYLGKDFNKLKEICKEINSGTINDPQNRLLGFILSILYPKTIPANEILNYLKGTGESLSGDYDYFWRYQLPDRSDHEQLELLLDQLSEKFNESPKEFRSEGKTNFGSACFSIILYHFLEKSEDALDLDKLFSWLGVTKDANFLEYLGQSYYSTKIHEWFKARPDIWNALFSRSVIMCSSKSENYDELSCCLYEEKKGRLFNYDVLIHDYRHWYHEQSSHAKNRIVTKYITQAIAASDKQNLLRPNNPSEQRPNWHDQVKPYQKKLQTNKLQPGYLYNLAEVYFGIFNDLEGDSPRTRLEYILDRDNELVAATLSGFSQVLLRTDLPSASKIIRQYSENIRHPLSLPLFAGFEEKIEDEESFLQNLENENIRLAVAVYLTTGWLIGKYIRKKYKPEQQKPYPIWFGWILSNHPKIVADISVEFALARFRSKTSVTQDLHDLCYLEGYKEVAKYSVFRILKQFPVRCNSKQLTQLGYLFSATKRLDLQNTLDLVDKKLKHSSMNIQQRIYWLSLGLCLDPDNFESKINREISINERRIRYFANSIEKDFFSLPPDTRPELKVRIFSQIIKLLGSSFSPYAASPPGKIVSVTRAMDKADSVKDYINQLYQIPSLEATEALEKLVEDKQLNHWKKHLEHAYQRQKVNRREAEFKYFSVEDIHETLENKNPSNPADLSALTNYYLNEIGENIRNSSSSNWKQYWNEDSYGRPTKPKHENSCRNNLLSALEYKLPEGIACQREATHSNDKRSDIRISFSKFNVPIEVKRSCHRSIWTSIESQLIAKYTKNRGSDGYGIYVVFWFGNTEDCKPQVSRMRTRPSSPEELEEQLINSLTPEQKRKIQVCVIDVSNQKIS